MTEIHSSVLPEESPENNVLRVISRETRLLHLELSANAVDEEFPAVFSCVHESRAADLWPHAADDALHLVVWEQVGNLSLNEQRENMKRSEIFH